MNIGLRKIIRAAVIAAIYVALCLVFAPISYGTVQVRVSEALTLLVVLCPEALIGVTVGCFISNMIASAPIDMLVGTLATLIAGVCTFKMRKMRFKGLALAPSVPPVIFNAVIVGAELTLLFSPANSPLAVWLINMASVGIGQIISCSVLGVLLVFLIERNKALHRMLTE